MLELTMATVAEDTGATAGMLMAEAPSRPGSVLRVGRDPGACRLVAPEGWLFVSRIHLEFRCTGGAWTVAWVHGSLATPSSAVRVTVNGDAAAPLAYGGSLALPPGASGEAVIQDLGGPRAVHVGFFHEA